MANPPKKKNAAIFRCLHQCALAVACGRACNGRNGRKACQAGFCPQQLHRIQNPIYCSQSSSAPSQYRCLVLRSFTALDVWACLKQTQRAERRARGAHAQNQLQITMLPFPLYWPKRSARQSNTNAWPCGGRACGSHDGCGRCVHRPRARQHAL